METTRALTDRQAAALALVAREGKVSSRCLAGELGTRAQDAGRTLASLEREGFLRFDTDGGRAGYVSA